MTAATFDADAGSSAAYRWSRTPARPACLRAKRRERIAREDFIAEHDASSYAIAVDPSGKLTWSSSDIDGEHVITILTESVSDDYLAFLQSKGVSYVFGGKSRIDLTTALRKLRSRFGIRKLLLEGGGRINGSFLAGI